MLTRTAQQRGIFKKKASIATDANAQAFFDAIVAAGGTPLTTAEKTAWNACIVGLKGDASNVWARLFRLGWFGNSSLIASKIDVVNPAKVWSMATVGGVTPWVAYQGYTGDVANLAYVSSIDNIAFNGPDDGSGGGIINQTNGSANTAFAEFGSVSTEIRCTHGTGTASTTGLLNGSSGTSSYSGDADRNGYSCVSRTTAGTINFLRNSTFKTGSSSGSALTSSPMYALRRGSAYSPDRALCAFWGYGLTTTQMAALRDRLNTLAGALGCPLS